MQLYLVKRKETPRNNSKKCPSKAASAIITKLHWDGISQTGLVLESGEIRVLGPQGMNVIPKNIRSA